MTVVWAVLALVLVFVIAAVTIGREARRLDAQPPSPPVHLDEAVAFIAERLPFEASATLRYADVRTILEWHIEFLEAQGVKAADRAPVTDEPVVLDDEQVVDHLLLRAAAEGEEYTPEQVRAVLDGALAYFEAIGAVGPEAEGEL